MRRFRVTGMSCAACSARVEKAVSGVDGVESCSVNLLTGEMGVEGGASDGEIIRAVEKAGYGALSLAHDQQKKDQHDALKDVETPKLLARLIASVAILLPLMYISMGVMMFGFPLPPVLENNHLAQGLIQMLLAAVILIINKKFFISGFRGVVHGSPNMDTLVALGSGVAFVWSVYLLFDMTHASVLMDHARMMRDADGLHFEAAAMILTLITVGKTLESYSKGKTTSALRGLMDLTPKTATVLRGEEEITVPAEEVRRDDLFVVRPGQSFPVDGVVIEGESSVDESALTGESVPVDKAPGDAVSAATINRSGYLKCRALRVGEDTTLSQIIRMVSDASATKAPIARIADKVSGVFVPAVLGIALITLTVWLIVGRGANLGYALERAISVLVISCPCALGLATPVAIMVGSGVGAKNGILYKTSEALESAGRTQIVVLDKTGTVTEGQPKVTDLLPEGGSEEELLRLAAALESKSEHPLARAIMEYAGERGAEIPASSSFEAMPGNGLRAVVEGKTVCAGKLSFIEQTTTVTERVKARAEELSKEGKTPLFFAADGKLLGVIAVADKMKEESPEAIRQLKGMGVRVVMLTGDNARTAQAIGERAGVDAVISGVLPDGKAHVIEKLKTCGKTMMVGDGINDAPALTVADIGAAIGAGTDVAIDAADAVLVKSRLTDVPACIRLGRNTVVNIYENLFWAFIYNLIGIPLAAGAFIPLLGWELPPMFGALAMSLSSFCVVMNALRLNLTKPHSAARDRKHKPADISAVIAEEENKEEQTMQAEKTLTLKIEGMMCPHCEATVKKTIEAFNEVTSADVSHEKGTAVLHYTNELTCLDEIRKAIVEKGYEVK